MQGTRLAQATGWLARHPNPPPPLVEFHAASCNAEVEAAQKEREAQEREITRQKELRQQAEARAEAEETAAVHARRSAVLSRRLSYALGVLFLIAAGAAIFARWQQLAAQSRELAAKAEQIVDQDQPEALALAIRGWHTAKTAEASLAVSHASLQVLATLEGHTGIVMHAAFSPDGRRIVTASEDHTARVWNAANGQLLANLEGHTGLVWQAAFSPDGQRVVTASFDNTARVWNAV